MKSLFEQKKRFLIDRKMKLLWKFMIILLIISIMSLPGLYIALVLPSYSGKITIESSLLKNPISIHRDEYAIPHIKAKDYKDAIFGLGFVHGQDRLWSMQVKRIVAAGELSKYFDKNEDKSLLDIDKFLKVVGIYRISKEVSRHLMTEELEILQSYSNGINEAYKQSKVPGIENLLLNMPFKEWTVVDSIAIQKLFLLGISSNWWAELLRTRLLHYFSPNEIESIVPFKSDYLFENTFVVNNEELKQAGYYHEDASQNKSATNKPIEAKEKEQNKSQNKTSKDAQNPSSSDSVKITSSAGKGSNAWVVHGTKTKTIKPILCNDPHLLNTMPSSFYQAELLFGEKFESSIIGGTISGIPSYLVGKTDFFGFGVTSQDFDNIDFYQEKLNDAGTHYFVNGSLYPFQMREEFVEIGNERIIIEVKSRKHGPIFCPLIEKLHFPKILDISFGENISFCWTGYENEDHSFYGGKSLVFAQTPEDFVKAIKKITIPLHMHWAFYQGDIGYTQVGSIPLKQYTHEKQGYILDGTDPNQDWLDWMPNNEKVSAMNPKKGFFSSANNKVANSSVLKYHFSETAMGSPRSYRIHQILTDLISKGRINDTDLMQMQQDVFDPYVEKIKPCLVDLLEHFSKLYPEKNLNSYTKVLKEWNTGFAKESKAALLYSIFEHHFFKNSLDNIEDKAFSAELAGSIYYEQYMFRQVQDWHKAFLSYPENFTCEKLMKQMNFDSRGRKHLINPCIILDSFIRAIKELEEICALYGPSCSYSSVHKAHFIHAPFTMNSWLKPIFDREYPSGGNRRTIRVGTYNMGHKDFNAISGANIRMVINMAESFPSYYILDTGISENPFSSHYTDQMELYIQGKYIEAKSGLKNLPNFHILHISPSLKE